MDLDTRIIICIGLGLLNGFIFGYLVGRQGRMNKEEMGQKKLDEA